MKPADALLWQWPIDVHLDDELPELTAEELQQLRELLEKHGRILTTKWYAEAQRKCARFLAPLDTVLDYLKLPHRAGRYRLAGHLLAEMERMGTGYWKWSSEDWQGVFFQQPRLYSPGTSGSGLFYLVGFAYLVRGYRQVRSLRGHLPYSRFAQRIFGEEVVEQESRAMTEVLVRTGYTPESAGGTEFLNSLASIYLANGSPLCGDLRLEMLEALNRDGDSGLFRRHLKRVAFALEQMEVFPRTQLDTGPEACQTAEGEMSPEWFALAQRWLSSSTLARSQGYYYAILMVGRWLAQQHSEVASPADWNRDLADDFMRDLGQWQVGDYWSNRRTPHPHLGHPLSPASKIRILNALRRFFLDFQAWSEPPPPITPNVWFRRSGMEQPVIAPRVIAQDIWAKLLYAGLNLTAEDLPMPPGHRDYYYPFTMIRALALVWLFCGLRANEIRRLRVGCIRWQRLNADEPPVCFLEVPVGKTETAFSKPVDRVVGEAIEAWEQARPASLSLPDPKTNERVQFLFTYRGRLFGERYITTSLIPILCDKAGVPREDVRGNITSHRARSTIASQLANAPNPMSLPELQEWLAHRSLRSTQHYVQMTPVRQAKAYRDAGYLARNTRMIEVLVDRDAIRDGSAASGAPWQFFDLRHGYCSYQFFDQCPHRLVCARCSFYIPAASSEAQILEARGNLQRMRQFIELTDSELAAVEEGLEALEQLQRKLAGLPPPDRRQPATSHEEQESGGVWIPLASIR